MLDPVNEVPTPALIDLIQMQFKETLRQELPELIALARKVEAVHADDVSAPHGLTNALTTIAADLEDHMHKEEAIVFSGLYAGKFGKAARSLAGLRHDHAEHEVALNRVAAITHGFRLPSHACASWRRLYAGLGKLAGDLDEHRYLEEAVLFPRFESAG